MLVCGAASALGFAPLGWWPVWVGAVACFLVSLSQAPWQRQWWLGWVFGLGAAMATTHWIGVALWQGIPKGAAVGATAIAWLYCAWPWGLVGMLSGALRRYPLDQHCGPSNSVSRLACLTSVLVVAWWSQAWWLSGFPWLVPGAVWLDTPLQGWGPVGGGLLMAALGLGLAAALAWGWQTQQALRAKRIPKTWRTWQGVALVWVGVFGTGAALQRMAWTEATAQPVRVGVVQADIPLTDQLPPGQLEAYQRMAWRISLALISRHDVNVVVWPEGMVSTEESPLRAWLTQNGSVLRQTALVMGALIREPQAPAALPVTAVRSSTTKAHNSLLAHGPGSGGRYDKRELVPLVESWPERGPWPMMADWASSRPWIQPGAAVQTPLVLAGQQVGASICYEDAFAHVYQGLPATVSWLINASDDGWFANSPAMPAQHLALSRLRALEQRKPLVRSANIGPSAVVGAWGEIITQTGTGKPQMLHADIQPRQGHTPYARWGHTWLWAMVLLVVCSACLWRIRRKNRPLTAD